MIRSDRPEQLGDVPDDTERPAWMPRRAGRTSVVVPGASFDREIADGRAEPAVVIGLHQRIQDWLHLVVQRRFPVARVLEGARGGAGAGRGGGGGRAGGGGAGGAGGAARPAGRAAGGGAGGAAPGASAAA